MSNSYINNKNEFLDLLHQRILKSLPKKNAKQIKGFIQKLFSVTPLTELKVYNQCDLDGSVISFWHFLELRKKDELKIKIFNPNYEKNGWHSPHTIIYILNKDMPFIIDSLRMKLNEFGLNVHHIRHGAISITRDKKNKLIDLSISDTKNQEAFGYIEITRQEASIAHKDLERSLIHVIKCVNTVVDSYNPMLKSMKQLVKELCDERNANDRDAEEVIRYLKWLIDNHFTFLGLENLILSGKNNLVKRSNGLGFLSESWIKQENNYDEINSKILTLNNDSLSFSKASNRSSVHRPAYPDYIILKRFNKSKELKSATRIMGLYTSPVYQQSPKEIPYLRQKVDNIHKKANISSQSHHGKALDQIIEVFPRDELFLFDKSQLFDTVMGILHIQERHQVKVFIRRDLEGVFASVLVFVPRDIYSTEFRLAVLKILYHRLQVEESEFTTYFSESTLARIHFIMRLKPETTQVNDNESIAQEILEVSQSWHDLLSQSLLDQYGEYQGKQIEQRFALGFPASYREAFSPESGVVDCEYLNRIDENNKLEMSFYHPLNRDGKLHFKVFHLNEALPLADVIAIMENLGLKVTGSYPYKIKLANLQVVWLHDFSLAPQSNLNLEELSFDDTLFKEAFASIWYNKAENDRLNRLVPEASIPWYEVVIMRGYSRYLKQIHFPFSQEYIADTLCNNIKITQLLMELFHTRFDPKNKLALFQRKAQQQYIKQQLFSHLESVAVLSEDQILRQFVSLIDATVRTNFYQAEDDTLSKETIAFKFLPNQIPEMPLPVPKFEIFVYSPRLEGVHLRGGKIARGGLRWSDRAEDFRTEILGLVKAQQVKNSVIVPMGAKGGFVPKKIASLEDRNDIFQEGIACYKILIRSLLSLTDNLKDNKIIKPENVLCYDDDDYYLVVAADKGTATFSDIANEIAENQNFWLGDAFASGGSVGYDHKKMGITAKGAWVSVQRHFRERNIDCQKEKFTVVGIGDMSGDVFGNGLLLSKQIALVAAFNHQHIFIDPNPDTALSLKERNRLFKLPRSSWLDYNQNFISKGGGVYPRSAKYIKISTEAAKTLNIRAKELSPTDLIKAILRAPVDLLWNGGIGTYVKTSSENHTDVGDKSNDAVRINGSELNCKIVGEGGNLGFTQLGRVEFALNNGAVNTDFIDNSAGVDCSDHEVNIKILLNELVDSGNMTRKQRDQFLESMTEDVSRLVLKNNYRQTQAITLSALEFSENIDEYKQFISGLEKRGKLNRAVEYLPSDQEITERFKSGQGLTRPELSVLISYSKLDLKEQLLKSTIFEDPYIIKQGTTAFPKKLIDEHFTALCNHRLSRELATTQISNALINMMGITFVNRQMQSTGASISDVIKAFLIAKEIFQIDHYWKMIETLDYKINAQLQHKMMLGLMRLMRRATRWLLRIDASKNHINQRIEHYSRKILKLSLELESLITGSALEQWQQQKSELINHAVSEDLAHAIASSKYAFNFLYIIQIAEQTEQSLERAAQCFFSIGNMLELPNFYKYLASVEGLNRWQALARESIRDEVGFQQCSFTVALLKLKEMPEDISERITLWRQNNQDIINRWLSIQEELEENTSSDLAIYSVLARELMTFAQKCSKS